MCVSYSLDLPLLISSRAIFTEDPCLFTYFLEIENINPLRSYLLVDDHFSLLSYLLLDSLIDFHKRIIALLCSHQGVRLPIPFSGNRTIIQFWILFLVRAIITSHIFVKNLKSQIARTNKRTQNQTMILFLGKRAESPTP